MNEYVYMYMYMDCLQGIYRLPGGKRIKLKVKFEKAPSKLLEVLGGHWGSHDYIWVLIILKNKETI